MTFSTSPIASVKTDKTSYSQGENIEITGVMPPESYQKPISIEVFNPSHALYRYKTLGSYFGTFSYTLVVVGPLGPPGTYRIRATYKNQTAESLFTITKRTLSIPPIHAYFFYLDIVKLTHPENAPANQIKQLEALSSIISNSTYFAQIKALPHADRFIMPTGDGMVVGFKNYPEYAINLAIETHYEIAKHNQGRIRTDKLSVRIGIDSGPVFIVKDILGSDNVWGPAIIGARRIMDLGLDRHILISLAMRNELLEISPTSYSRLIDKPMRYSVKHGLVIRCCNVHGDGFGRATPPHNKK